METAVADGGVLLDLDGLLVGTEPLWRLAERIVAERLGKDITPADAAELPGCSMARTAEILLDGAENPAHPADAEGWLSAVMLRLVCERPVPALPGARQLLDGIAGWGLPCALVTSTGLRLADAILASARMTFRVVVCGDDVRRAKPDPEPYQRAASLLGIGDLGSCVAIEDSRAGVTSAEAAGCQVIAVPSGKRISPAPGRIVVRSLADLEAGPHGLNVRAGVAWG